MLIHILSSFAHGNAGCCSMSLWHSVSSITLWILRVCAMHMADTLPLMVLVSLEHALGFQQFAVLHEAQQLRLAAESVLSV